MDFSSLDDVFKWTEEFIPYTDGLFNNYNEIIEKICCSKINDVVNIFEKNGYSAIECDEYCSRNPDEIIEKYIDSEDSEKNVKKFLICTSVTELKETGYIPLLFEYYFDMCKNKFENNMSIAKQTHIPEQVNYSFKSM